MGVGKKVDGKVVWDDKQRDWLAKRMKRKVNFTNKTVTDKPVAEWDVSALCSALRAVLTPEADIIVKQVEEVKYLRNTTFHGKRASHDDRKPDMEAVWNLKPHVMAVWNLIQSVESSFLDQPCWKEYLEELNSAADSELHTCYDMICRPLHEALVL